MYLIDPLLTHRQNLCSICLPVYFKLEQDFHQLNKLEVTHESICNEAVETMLFQVVEELEPLIELLFLLLKLIVGGFLSFQFQVLFDVFFRHILEHIMLLSLVLLE